VSLGSVEVKLIPETANTPVADTDATIAGDDDAQF
jgi:hypothetical protein